VYPHDKRCITPRLVWMEDTNSRTDQDLLWLDLNHT
jgi:hypothetical protein